MENLNKEDLQQLLVFYRQKTNDLEFKVLENQLILNKIIQENQMLKSQNSLLQSKVDSLTNEIEHFTANTLKKKQAKSKE